MPELLEIELYRRAAEQVVGRKIVDVPIADTRFVRHSPDLAMALRGALVLGVRRHGKVLLLDTDGPTLGLRFGMTGMLRVDGIGPIERLAYGPASDSERYGRLCLLLDDGGRLAVSDARRFGSAELDPDLSKLGPDAATITRSQLARALRGTTAVKAALLDQERVAGLGNMLVDEILLRARIDPARPTGSLTPREVGAVQRSIAVVLPELLAAGGSHAGRLSAGRRHAGATCPLDGAQLERRRIGGRTTYSCPRHQR